MEVNYNFDAVFNIFDSPRRAAPAKRQRAAAPAQQRQQRAASDHVLLDAMQGAAKDTTQQRHTHTNKNKVSTPV